MPDRPRYGGDGGANKLGNGTKRGGDNMVSSYRRTLVVVRRSLVLEWKGEFDERIL